jgi:tripartite-type tricarboxylate transporter receptor subunit TctC
MEDRLLPEKSHDLTRRTVIAGAIGAAGAVARPFVARAQNWPSGATIKFVVPYPPGGSTDVIARLVQPMLQQRLGATIIIDNRAGASGSLGTAAVAKSPPDGTTWLIAFDNHAANPFVLPSLPFNTEQDLDPVLLIGTAPYLVASSSEKPYRNLADILAAAKAKANSVSYGSVGSGSIGHLAMVLLAKQAGVSLIHVPYRGGGPAMNDAIAGHVDLLVGSVALSLPQVQSGKLRAVFHMGKERIAALPDVASASESGFPSFNAYAWWGVFAPAGTAKPIIERFRAELTASLREPNVTKQLVETQQINMLLAGPEELRTFLDDQMRTWGAVVKENNIKGDI